MLLKLMKFTLDLIKSSKTTLSGINTKVIGRDKNSLFQELILLEREELFLKELMEQRQQEYDKRLKKVNELYKNKGQITDFTEVQRDYDICQRQLAKVQYQMEQIRLQIINILRSQ